MLKIIFTLFLIFITSCYHYDYEKYEVDFLNDIPYRNQYAYAEMFKLSDSGQIKIDSSKVFFADFIIDTSKYITDSINVKYENPFSPNSSLHFTLKEEKDLKIYLYTILGDSLPLFKEKLNPGEYILELRKSFLNAGVYFIRVNNTEEHTAVMLLMAPVKYR